MQERRPVGVAAWLVPGGVLAAACVGVFVWTLPLGTTASVAGILLVVGLYAAMVVVAIAVRPATVRNVAVGGLLALMAIAAVGVVLVQALAAAPG